MHVQGYTFMLYPQTSLRMAPKSLPFRSLSKSQGWRRLKALESAAREILLEDYTVKREVDGTILLVPPSPAVPASEDADGVDRQACLFQAWRMRSMGLSLRNTEYGLRDLDRKVNRSLFRKTLNELRHPPSLALTVTTATNQQIIGAYVPLAAKLLQWAACYRLPVPSLRQPDGCLWVNLACDGTKRWQKSYCHMTIGATFAPECQLSSWFLLQGQEKWATLLAFTAAMGASGQLSQAMQTPLVVAGIPFKVRFFLLADGKGLYLPHKALGWEWPSGWVFLSYHAPMSPWVPLSYHAPMSPWGMHERG